MATLLDYDEMSGVAQYAKRDGDQTIIKTVQDVGPTLRDNEVARQNQTSGFKGDMHHVARIPMALIDKWWKELGDNPLLPRNRKWLAAKLNSSDFLKLRVKDGTI